MKVLLALLCSLLVACANRVSSSAPVSTEQLVGKWYRGDGTGYNVVLTLNRDLSYNAVWFSDGGILGDARGSWKFTRTKLILLLSEEKHMKHIHLRTLDVLPNKQGVVLVAPEDRKLFDKWGAESSLYCFTPTR